MKVPQFWHFILESLLKELAVVMCAFSLHIGHSISYLLSLHSLHKILRPQMRVPCQHLKRLVASNRSDLHRIKTLLEKPTGCLMSEIVEVKPGDPRLPAGFGKVL